MIFSETGFHSSDHARAIPRRQRFDDGIENALDRMSSTSR